MALQTQVYIGSPEAVPGLPASNEPERHLSRLSGTGLRPGRFAFRADPDINPDIVNGTALEAGAPPLGIVRRWVGYAQTDFLSPGSEEIPAGAPLDVMVAGDIWIELEDGADPALEDFVFAPEAGGKAKCGPDPSAAPTGYAPTHWRISRIGDALVVASSPNTALYVAPASE